MFFMIIDALANMEFYKGLNEQLYKGLTFLKENDVASLPVGRYDIDGDAVFALVQEYETHLPEECRWEAHYTYTDIQYVVEGSEKMGWNTLDDILKTEDRPEDDVYYFETGEMTGTPVIRFQSVDESHRIFMDCINDAIADTNGFYYNFAFDEFICYISIIRSLNCR